MKFIHKKDGIIIGGILLAALFLFLFFRQGSGTDLVALIYHEKELVMEIELKQGVQETFSVPGYPQVVFEQFPDGTICFRSSDCPDKVCVKTGKLGKSGESAACLPNGLILNVRSKEAEKEQIDAVTG